MIDTVYEINEKGERTLIRSIDSTKQAFVRFTNCTSRPVELWWRDFKGARRRYVCLLPGVALDINTFLTHPWEFTDCKTGESFVINNKPVFRAPANIADMRFRTNWNITVTVRSLRYNCLLVIALKLPSQRAANVLNLPRSLVADLKLILAKLGHKY